MKDASQVVAECLDESLQVRVARRPSQTEKGHRDAGDRIGDVLLISRVHKRHVRDGSARSSERTAMNHESVQIPCADAIQAFLGVLGLWRILALHVHGAAVLPLRVFP